MAIRLMTHQKARLIAGLLLALCAGGAVVRLAFLDTQIVMGDEVHAIRVARQNDLPYVLTHFHESDNCIPITAWCSLLLRVISLEEWGLRFLAYAPGIALVFAAGFASRRFLPAAPRAFLTLLIAGSPLLVFWSRQGRPYSAVVLLGVLTTLALVRFAVERRPRWLFASALGQALLVYFSPTSAPFVIALALAALAWALFPANGRSLGARVNDAVRILAPFVLGAFFAGLLVGPAIPTLLEILGPKQSTRSPLSGETLVHALRLVYGLPFFELYEPAAAWVAIPAALTLLGLEHLRRTNPRFFLPALLILASPVAYLPFDFKSIGYPLTFVRYQAAVVPFYLGFCVYGLDLLGRTASARGVRLTLWATAWVAAILLVVLGPLSSGMPPRYPFGLNFSRLFDPERLEDQAQEWTAGFYGSLEDARRCTFIEWPGSPDFLWMYSVHQQRHRGRVLWFQDRSRSDRLDFKTAVFGLQALERRTGPLTYVVLHKKPAAERARLRGVPEEAHHLPRGEQIEPLTQWLEARAGKPVYEDEWTVSFDWSPR